MLIWHMLNWYSQPMDDATGRILRATRERRGITQAELALRTGVSQATISRVERGERGLSLEGLDRLLRALGEQLEVRTTPLPRRYDPVHRAAEARLTPAERLERAFAWTAFNDAVLRGGRAARS
ncbi:MAG: hypothetical protein QOE27_2324 [Solirubrobacteraceae bacterium]|nr:hypothetical protein [Solirubrobacteraceae bacterium]